MSKYHKRYYKLCKFCNNEFMGFKNGSYCSYSCSARASIKQKPQCNPIIKSFSKNCVQCNNNFLTKPGKNGSLIKCCSKECANLKRKLALSENRYLIPKKEKRGRASITKICIECGKVFINSNSNNKRQLSCSRECGYKQSQIGRKIEISKEQLENLLEKYPSVVEIVLNTGISYHALRRRMKDHGLKYKKKEIIRSDGYYGYTTKKNHRKILEAHIGRKLLPKESVHHINGDKIDNRIENLFLCDKVSRHNEVHTSLMKCGFELVKKGAISFRDGFYILNI